MRRLGLGLLTLAYLLRTHYPSLTKQAGATRLHIALHAAAPPTHTPTPNTAAAGPPVFGADLAAIASMVG